MYLYIAAWHVFVELPLFSTADMLVCQSTKTPTQIERDNMLAKKLTSKRATKFREQFNTYSFPSDYFEISGKDNITQFDRDCNKILDSFKSKFLIGGDRAKYLETFSIEKWCELPVVERNEHTLSNCVRCFEKHGDCQHSFPLKPMFEHKPLVVLDQDALLKQGINKFTSNVS